MPDVLTNAKIYIGGLDVSGQANSVALNHVVDAKEVTTFGNDTQINTGGLRQLSMQVEGFWQSIDDALLFPGIGGRQVVTLMPDAATVGNRAFTAAAIQSEYTPGAGVGDPLAYSISFDGAGNLGRGQLNIVGTKTATGNGAAQQLGALSSTQKMIAALHVLAVSGTAPKLNVTIESDSTSGFASPTTVGTFAQITAAGGYDLVIDGPITDTYFRLVFTISGTSPSFTLAGALGITV